MGTAGATGGIIVGFASAVLVRMRGPGIGRWISRGERGPKRPGEGERESERERERRREWERERGERERERDDRDDDLEDTVAADGLGLVGLRPRSTGSRVIGDDGGDRTTLSSSKLRSEAFQLGREGMVIVGGMLG